MPENHPKDANGLPLAGHDHHVCTCGGNCRGCPNHGHKHGHGHNHGHDHVHADED